MLIRDSFATVCRALTGYAVGAALVAAAAPVAFARMPGDPVPLIPAALHAASADAGAGALPSGYDDIRTRIETTGGLTVAGERLRGPLLRRFYAAYGFQPVWERRPAETRALLNLVLRAGDHGLDPDLFHAALLRNPEALRPVERDLVLSSAFLGYADALARGAVPRESRSDNEDLSPEPVDVVAVLNYAIASVDPAAAIEALAPKTPTYLALREALQAHPARDGRYRDLAVNLERQRWLPRNIPAERVWVNSANAQLVYYRGDLPLFTTRVIVGTAATERQTPEFRIDINGIVLNPPWNVPYSIVVNEIMPQLARDPNYLSKRRMVYRPDGGIQQQPGPGGSALGQLKFDMDNRFDVYLHDTPQKALFNRDNRRISHGCVRVQNPRELAALLLHEPVATVDKAIALGHTNRRALPAPVPAFMVYHTAFVDTAGRLVFHPDVYSRNEQVWRGLQPVRQAPVAQHDPAGGRRG